MIASVTFPALGTTASVFVTDPGAIGVARSLLEEELQAIDQACSRFRPDSELQAINRARGQPVVVSELFCEALEVALRAARLTDGDVDPTVGRALRAIGYDRDFAEVANGRPRPTSSAAAPGWGEVRVDRDARTVRVAPGVELDLGATAKALAADRAARRIGQTVAGGVLVSLGGDLATAGPAPPGGWRVLVTDDHAAGATGGGQTVSLDSGGLATSSTTVRRWLAGGEAVHHIVDPRSGTSVSAVWQTVSVAAASCVDANTASTAAIVRGERAPRWLAGLRLPSRLVSTRGEVVHVAGWPEEKGE